MKFSTAKIQINLRSIKNNYLFLKQYCKKSEVAAMVKASSYGLGGKNKIVHLLRSLKCNNFFVANLNEAITIRKKFNDINIYVLNGLNKNEENIFFKNNIIPVLNTYDQLCIWIKYLKKNYNKKLVIHVDTGMNRLGFQDYDVKKLIKNKKILSKFKNILFMSHLACSEDKKNQYNKIQKQKFDALKKEFPNYKYSLAASGGIFLGKEYHYDMVRPGIALYGGKLQFHKKLKHVVSLKAPIIQISEVPKNSYFGYSNLYKAKKNMTSATICVGYADGIGIRLTNKGFAMFGSEKLPMIGRISMDLIILDITKIKKKIKVGDFVDIFNNDLTIDKFAKISDTIPYRIITSTSQRFEKIYLE